MIRGEGGGGGGGRIATGPRWKCQRGSYSAVDWLWLWRYSFVFRLILLSFSGHLTRHVSVCVVRVRVRVIFCLWSVLFVSLDRSHRAPYASPAGRPHPTLPATSTPLHDPPTADGAPPTAAPSHRPAYQGPTSPIERAPPPATLPKPASRTPVTPADDIQLPAVGFSHLPPGLGRPSGPPNGQYAQPPKYDELFSPPSPPKDSVSSPRPRADQRVLILSRECDEC